MSKAAHIFDLVSATEEKSDAHAHAPQQEGSAAAVHTGGGLPAAQPGFHGPKGASPARLSGSEPSIACSRRATQRARAPPRTGAGGGAACGSQQFLRRCHKQTTHRRRERRSDRARAMPHTIKLKESQPCEDLYKAVLTPFDADIAAFTVRRRLLVAVDASAAASQAVKWTLDNFARDGDLLTLCTVVPASETAGPDTVFDDDMYVMCVVEFTGGV